MNVFLDSLDLPLYIYLIVGRVALLCGNLLPPLTLSVCVCVCV